MPSGSFSFAFAKKAEATKAQPVSRLPIFFQNLCSRQIHRKPAKYSQYGDFSPVRVSKTRHSRIHKIFDDKSSTKLFEF
jgi:hypothetical protein